LDYSVYTDGSVRTYTSPMIKDIKVKNSPLWTADPDQQLFYFASDCAAAEVVSPNGSSAAHSCRRDQFDQ
jgi:hypothetical protein